MIGSGNFGIYPEYEMEIMKHSDYTIIAYGSFFISTPDSVTSLKKSFPLNIYNRITFYEPITEEGNMTTQSKVLLSNDEKCI